MKWKQKRVCSLSSAPRHLGRRAALRGVMGGVATSVALPPLEAMFNDNGTAYAQDGTLPKRFGVFFWGNGVITDKFVPRGTGTSWSLSPELMPLAGIKDYVTVVSGADVKTGNEQGHHAGTVGILSGSPMVRQDPGNAAFASTFSAPSIDQVVAGHIGGGTPFRSLEVGVSEALNRWEGTTLHYLSHNGPDNVNPAEYSTRAVFERIFGNFTARDAEPTGADPKLMLRRSVLDAVLADADELSARLGATDRMRLQQHMDGVRTLEQRIANLEMSSGGGAPVAACTAPGQPSETDALEEKSAIMSELIAMALACDQTRVFSNMFSGSVSGTRYPNTSDGHHSLTHDEPGEQPQVHSINIFIMRQLAGMLEALRDVPEGDGTLLDNCAILASTDTSIGVAHNLNDYPILVAGGAGGALARGVHYREQGMNASKVLLTCLQVMDIEVTEFGNGGGRVSSPVSQIMA